MDITIKCGVLTAVIDTHGAELKSVKNEKTGIEYIWVGDPSIWADHAPFLFPVVARQLDDKYVMDGVTRTMPMHGFAKDSDFEVKEKGESSVTFVMHETEQTLQWYPFRFTLETVYELKEDGISAIHRLTNENGEKMFFSMGEHPGFNAPMVPGDTLEDYYLEFSSEENAERWYLDDEIICGSEPYLDGKILKIDTHTFDRGALIFKGLKSEYVTLRSRNHDHSVKMDLTDWGYLGIWAKPSAPYVCIEPWNGLASSKWSSHDIWQKEGILCLNAGETKAYTMNITFA